MCTGYRHVYPFLEERLRLKTLTRFYPTLYMGTVFQKNPKVFYIGAQNQIYSLTMFDLQSYIARDMILGRLKMPSYEEMVKDTEERQKQ